MKRFWIILWLLPFWLKAGSVSYSTDTSDFANPERRLLCFELLLGPWKWLQRIPEQRQPCQ